MSYEPLTNRQKLIQKIINIALILCAVFFVFRESIVNIIKTTLKLK
jgi:hypothetical protein